MRRLSAVAGVLAMFGLTAAKCTPEQIAAVEHAYRVQVEAAPTASAAVFAGPGWRVEASCTEVRVILEGWTDVSDTLVDEQDPTRRVPFVIWSIGSHPPFALRLDDTGGVDHEQAINEPAGWEWSLWINGPAGSLAPQLNVSARVAC